MSDLVEWLLAATRPSLLKFIARAIHGLTIRSRAFYGDAENHTRMIECNEAIHRLAGHMAWLADAAHDLDLDRAGSLAANMRLLTPGEIGRLKGTC